MVDKLASFSDIRRKVYEEIEPIARTKAGLSIANWIFVLIILVGAGSAILETEVVLRASWGAWFDRIEIGIGIAFAAELALRLWTSVEKDGDESPFQKRLKFVFSFDFLFDFLVILSSLLPYVTANLLALRLFRLVRVLRIAKLGRMSRAMKSLTDAVKSRRYELLLTLYLAVALLILGATALYWIEGEAQPEKFGSIPRSLWWAVITMTTIGYGDVYPVTSLGKFVASLVALAGIGLIAMPTGILAAALSDAIQKQRSNANDD